MSVACLSRNVLAFRNSSVMVVSRKKNPQQKTSNSVFEGFTDVTINGFFVGSYTVYFFARLQDITTKCLCLCVAKAFLYPMPMCKSDST